MEEVLINEKEHAIQLENDLEEQSNKLFNENEDLSAKLNAEQIRSKQLEEKVILHTSHHNTTYCSFAQISFGIYNWYKTDINFSRVLIG